MYLVLDTETTGVEPTARIVAIAWAVYDESAVELALAHHVICPEGFTIPPEASAIHGITTEAARREGIPIKTALANFAADLERHTPVLLVGHNVGFDRPIVLNEYARLETPTKLGALPTYCTMKTTAGFCRIPRYNGGYKWPTLDQLHRKLFGRAHTAAHHARADVVACAKCFFELKRLGLARIPPRT